MNSTFLAGLALGLALIAPIGAQNVFVINQAIKLGMPRALVPALTASACDAVLIASGGLGVSALLNKAPIVKMFLLIAGALFLLYLGVQALRSEPSDQHEQASVSSLPRLVGKTVAVSLLNPHAIIDTVGVIGTSIAAVPSSMRLAFAGGSMTGSLLWFLTIAAAGAGFSKWLTPQRRQYLDRASGIVLLFFSLALALEAFRAFTH